MRCAERVHVRPFDGLSVKIWVRLGATRPITRLRLDDISTGQSLHRQQDGVAARGRGARENFAMLKLEIIYDLDVAARVQAYLLPFMEVQSQSRATTDQRLRHALCSQEIPEDMRNHVARIIVEMCFYCLQFYAPNLK